MSAGQPARRPFDWCFFFTQLLLWLVLSSAGYVLSGLLHYLPWWPW